MAVLERKHKAETAPERRLEIRSFLKGLKDPAGLIRWLGSRKPPDLSEWKGIPLPFLSLRAKKGFVGAANSGSEEPHVEAGLRSCSAPLLAPPHLRKISLPLSLSMCI